MYRKNEVERHTSKTVRRKESTSSSKMPSLFKKSTSDNGTLSENHRKVLHRCRMMLLKDLEVTDILDFMSQEEGLRSDTRDMILTYPTREQRVGILLDKLETRGDRVFMLFMEALREHYKHLHYVLEENLRNIDEKDSKNKDHKQSINGENVRKIIKNNLRKKAEYSQGSESADDLDIVFYDHEEDAYIDCYAIPTRGRLQKERWIKQMAEPPSDCLEQDECEEDTNYMAVVIRDILFKRIDASEIPACVKRPPKHCKIFVIDNENKYGLVKKERKSDSVTPDIAQSSRFYHESALFRGKNVTLDSQISHELPDYTAPPPPSKQSEQVDGRASPSTPPPLPPKPGNLPPLGFRPLVKLRPVSPKIEPNDQAKKEDDSKEAVQDEENIVKPPPRSTSLVQTLSVEDQFDDKPLPSPKGELDKSSKKQQKPSPPSKEGSPALSSSGSEKSDTSDISPPVPPRKYMESSVSGGSLTGAGAMINPSIGALSPKIEKKAFLPGESPLPPGGMSSSPTKNISSFDAEVKEDGSLVTPTFKTEVVEPVSVNIKSVKGTATLAIEEEEEFDPYSMGVDHIFQANGDLAVTPSKEDSQSSSTGTVEGSTVTVTRDDSAERNSGEGADSEEEIYDVDQQIPIQDEEYEVVNSGNEAGCENDEIEPLAQKHQSRDSTPSDSEDATKRDSRDASTLDSSFKASGDSLNSNTTPGSQGARSVATTDSGFEGGILTNHDRPIEPPPPLMKPQKSGGSSTGKGPGASRPLPNDPPLPTFKNLNDVQVFANDGDSSDTNSYYEDIDVLDKSKIPLIDTSERTSVSYLDPKTYFKAIERMAQQGLYKDSTLRRIAIVEEWEASGRALLARQELVIAENEEAYSVPKAETQAKIQVTQDVGSQSEALIEAENEDEIGECLDTEGGATGGADTDDISKDESSSMNTDETRVINKDVVSDEQPDIEPPKDVYGDYRYTTLAYDKVGRAFFVPSQYLKRHGDPFGEPWYYPIEISSHQATLFLSAQRQEGCFLVYSPRRKTRNNILYNLSVCRGHDEVVHYHIVQNIHGDIMIKGHDRSFLNVKDLIQYFQRNKSQLATKLRRPLKEASLPITPGYHYDLKWEISRSHLSLTGKIIGKGNYGVVCAGMYHSNIPVAVKVMQKSDSSVQEEDDFIDEAICLMGLNHEHVVRFVGLSCTAKPYFLLYEYLPKGNLRECLQNNVVPSDNIEQLFDLCIQITSSAYYLESQRFVLHRDLAARNFLVAEDLCVKLADFGRARYVTDDSYQAPKTEKIPIKWASPEVLIDSCYSTKSDVWALGIVYWEILSGGERPYGNLNGEQTAVYVTEGGRLEKPTGCPLDLFNMMNTCWQDDPYERPSFAALYEKLKSKSSIYYSNQVRPGPALPKVKSKKGDHHHHHHLPTSPVTPGQASKSGSMTPLSFASTSKAKIQRSISQSKKVRHTVMIETRVSDSVKDGLNNIKEEVVKPKQRPMSGGSERLATSGSETSLNSSFALVGMDDLTRGGKIRKSLRKIINIRPKRKSKLDGLQESNGKESFKGSSSMMYGSEY